ncbi:putative regucalcin protein [Rhypophila decipiens]|uniref:Regucalcin protein n=1 Tax=Rhypophila decipiens TaxID=261697 RepID=A0AAN6YBA7_9PEZI|nr:putative regucalcin protein [Rhypophila decipiens]
MAHQTEKLAEEWVVTEPYMDLHTALGEGPHYEPATNTLRFVDIINKRLHTVDLAAGPSSLKTLEFDVPVTVTADVEGYNPQEKLLIGAKYGLALLDRKTGQYEYLEGAKFEEGERTRSNDGEVDPHGRFWIGTMTDFGLGDFRDEGSLYTFDLIKKSKQLVKSKIIIPNSVGWSPDGKTVYFTNSTAREVIAWDYDATDGSVSNERIFYKHIGPGEPDGFRVDKDGNIWHAVYGESRVLKISPEGKLVGQIKLPTTNTTCCEFVGTELFITTAANGAEGEAAKYGGGLFRVDVGATGLGHGKVKLALVNGHANGSA